MNRALETFLVWLLLAVLPLHAVAGSRLSCGPVHQQSSQVAVDQGSQHHQPVADSHAHHGSEHASQGGESQAEAHSAAPGAGEQTHSTCSACSAFCLGAVAPPSTQLPVPTFDGSDAVAVAPPVFAVGFIQEGPQRPPRHQSA